LTYSGRVCTGTRTRPGKIGTRKSYHQSTAGSGKLEHPGRGTPPRQLAHLRRGGGGCLLRGYKVSGVRSHVPVCALRLHSLLSLGKRRLFRTNRHLFPDERRLPSGAGRGQGGRAPAGRGQGALEHTPQARPSVTENIEGGGGTVCVKQRVNE